MTGRNWYRNLAGLIVTSGVFAVSPHAHGADTVLVPPGSVWKFLDDGSNQGTAWRAAVFPGEGDWDDGPAQLGYGDGDEATEVGFGPDPNDKFTTTYFRHTFTVVDPSAFASAIVRVVRDDGAVVYLNGQEVYRTNMPAGTIDFDTFAASTVSGTAESQFFAMAVDPGLLTTGDNVFAVEVHQRNITSSDKSFDLEFIASDETPPIVFVPAGADWKFLDDGSNLGTAWQALAYPDGLWDDGPAQLGYGDGDEQTEVSFGPDPDNKYITTYFRHTFNIADLGAVQGGLLRVIRDDGIVVYLNETEVFRSNMPSGPPNYFSLAPGIIDGSAEDEWIVGSVPAGAFVAGDNILAVEIHQQRLDSSDISFDLELLDNDGQPLVTRGPYLQMGTSGSAIVRWRTTLPSDSRVSIGPAHDMLTTNVDDGLVTEEHVVPLNGLQPDTTYFYSIGTTAGALAGGDPEHKFVTAPTPGTHKPTRVWVIGDSGTGDSNAASVYDAYRTYAGGTPTDVWLMLGDNAYLNGADFEYQAAVFNMYPELLARSFVWPTIGNHDAFNADSPSESGVYYDVFTLPRNGEAGGMASGTEAYYSFDHGRIHFICLDSEDTDRTAPPVGTMFTWLEADLADTTADWIIAFWHHPPYTDGSHDSDDPGDSGGRLRDMREIALPILEAGGVDLVLCGHSHSYERSYLIDQAYGYNGGNSTPSFATLLANGNIFDAGDGQPAGDGAYTKPTGGQTPHEGAVYVVAGSSGKITSDPPLNHPVMVASLYELGSVVLDIDGDQLDAVFLDDAGVVRDSFTMLKGTPCPADTDLDVDVDVDDLVNVIVDWGSDGAANNGDVDGSGLVDVNDLVEVIVAWGPCT